MTARSTRRMLARWSGPLLLTAALAPAAIVTAQAAADSDRPVPADVPRNDVRLVRPPLRQHVAALLPPLCGSPHSNTEKTI